MSLLINLCTVFTPNSHICVTAAKFHKMSNVGDICPHLDSVGEITREELLQKSKVKDLLNLQIESANLDMWPHFMLKPCCVCYQYKIIFALPNCIHIMAFIDRWSLFIFLALCSVLVRFVLNLHYKYLGM